MRELTEQLLVDAHWRDLAACREEDPDLFFPTGPEGSEAERAKAVCAGCPVSEECLVYALETRQAYGIWGGTTARERRRLLRSWREGSAA